MAEARVFISEKEAQSLIQQSELLHEYSWAGDDYYRRGDDIARVRLVDGINYIVTGEGTEKTKVPDENAEQALVSKGYRLWLKVRRGNCTSRVLDGNEFFIEKIDGLGWTIEVEAESRGSVMETAKKLGFGEDRIEWRPVRELVLNKSSG
ncbi:hypothetical protein ACFLQ2_04115 [archaeon]